jgi:BirA family biotin operon repressor/biotin-[acetyl-CoA-carboxylase] ligase
LEVRYLDILAVKGECERLGTVCPEIVYYDIIDSTNTRAREYAKEHPENKNPVVFVADAQSLGRGRRGRSFCSNEGAGIYVSFLIYPEQRGAFATGITAYSAVALARAVESVCSASPMIKWVNDLYLNDKKLAGILAECEMDSDGKISHLVLGMGINVYKTELPEEISAIATAIEGATGERVSREKLLAHIIHEFISGLCDVYSPKIYNEYKSRLFVLGREITVLRAEEEYSARAVDLTEDYSLVVESERGREELYSGEISTKI